MSLLRATKEDTCPYCNRNVAYRWCFVDMIRDIFYCPLCNNKIDISKEDKK